MQRTNNRGSAFALAISAALLFGISGAIASDALSVVSPARAAQSRAMVAVVLLLPYAWYRRKLASRGPWSVLLLFGASLTAVNVAYYEAVDRIGVGPGMTLQFLAPMMVLVWMRTAEHRSILRSAWLAAAVAVAGTALIADVWQGSSMDLVGVGAGLAAAATFAVYLVIGERLGTTMAPSGIMAYGFTISALMWAVIQPVWSFPTDLPVKVWGELIWMGVLGTAIPFMLELQALQRASAGLVGVIATAEPVIGAVAALLMFSEKMAPVQVVGMVLIVGSVASVQRRGVAEVEVPLDAGR
ncbi:MAG TPA: EamA family transporter [Acidimicrobiia bacterium]|nr:EamA family transporter [Acidimicrobiia bacterium]